MDGTRTRTGRTAPRRGAGTEGSPRPAGDDGTPPGGSGHGAPAPPQDGPAPEELLQIGAMAERSGLSLRTLRHYDALGLLPPSGRTEGGYRVYTPEDLRRLMTIKRMKALDYSTAQMGELLRLLDVAEGTGPEQARREAREQLEALLADARARRERLAEQVRRADEFLRVLESRLG